MINQVQNILNRPNLQNPQALKFLALQDAQANPKRLPSLRDYFEADKQQSIGSAEIRTKIIEFFARAPIPPLIKNQVFGRFVNVEEREFMARIIEEAGGIPKPDIEALALIWGKRYMPDNSLFPSKPVRHFTELSPGHTLAFDDPAIELDKYVGDLIVRIEKHFWGEYYEDNWDGRISYAELSAFETDKQA